MSARLDTASPWRGVCFYENCCSGLRTKCLWDRLEESLGSEHELAMQLCRTDALNLPRVDREVRTEATLANVPIISVHDPTGLSSGVQKWYGRWLNSEHQQPRALVMLLDTEGESELLPSLRRMAQEAGVSVFVGHDTGTVACNQIVKPAKGGSASKSIRIEWAEEGSRTENVPCRRKGVI